MGLLVPVAFLAASSDAAVRAASGDTCTGTGTGTSYTLSITVPASGSQGGFAFGSTAATVTNIVIPGTEGTFASTGLPAKTSGAWYLSASAPATGETLTASITTSAPVTSFTVVAANAARTGFYDPITCGINRGSTGGLPNNKFTAGGHYVYNAGTHAWHNTVTLPGAGSLVFNQAFAHASNGLPAKKKALVAPGHLAIHGAGKVTVILKPTSAGLAALKASKSSTITLNLSVTFTPKGGRPAAKLLHLTLKK
jgi:hypothetical protein